LGLRWESKGDIEWVINEEKGFSEGVGVGNLAIFKNKEVGYLLDKIGQ